MCKREQNSPLWWVIDVPSRQINDFKLKKEKIVGLSGPRPEHPWLDGLYVASDVGLWVHDVSVLRHLVQHGLVFVGEDDVGLERFHTQ